MRSQSRDCGTFDAFEKESTDAAVLVYCLRVSEEFQQAFTVSLYYRGGLTLLPELCARQALAPDIARRLSSRSVCDALRKQASISGERPNNVLFLAGIRVVCLMAFHHPCSARADRRDMGTNPVYLSTVNVASGITCRTHKDLRHTLRPVMVGQDAPSAETQRLLPAALACGQHHHDAKVQPR